MLSLRMLSLRTLSTVTVIVETVEDGHTRSQHFTVDSLSEGSILRSLVLAVDQTQPGSHVTLYVDCVSQGMVATPRDLRDMFYNMAEPKLQVFRERRYVLEVDGAGGLSSVLNRNNCPSNIMQAIRPPTAIDINSIHRRYPLGALDTHEGMWSLLARYLATSRISYWSSRHTRGDVEPPGGVSCYQ
ncbi:unnamed protein product [Timema podura]|uniref:Uncharacterized protein n=1 Tax=Timema podura TaxID=61482 RepID=A0ABN7PF84_TIMPD|nr:unnamed protein product [Timema podura]